VAGNEGVSASQATRGRIISSSRPEGGGYPMNQPVTLSLTPEELKLLLEIVESHQVYFNWYPDECLEAEYQRVLALLDKLRSIR
jgi:hypothetical protein